MRKHSERRGVVYSAYDERIKPLREAEKQARLKREEELGRLKALNEEIDHVWAEKPADEEARAAQHARLAKLRDWHAQSTEEAARQEKIAKQKLKEIREINSEEARDLGGQQERPPGIN